MAEDQQRHAPAVCFPPSFPQRQAVVKRGVWGIGLSNCRGRTGAGNISWCSTRLAVPVRSSANSVIQNSPGHRRGKKAGSWPKAASFPLLQSYSKIEFHTVEDSALDFIFLMFFAEYLVQTQKAIKIIKEFYVALCLMKRMTEIQGFLLLPRCWRKSAPNLLSKLQFQVSATTCCDFVQKRQT